MRKIASSATPELHCSAISSPRPTNTDANGYPIPDPNGARLYTTTDNALGAVNYGLELIARQRLLFLPAPFNGLGVSLSATLTKSDGKYPGRLEEQLPTYGFSDRIYNAALEYNAGRFRARLSYTYRSDFLEGLDVGDDVALGSVAHSAPTGRRISSMMARFCASLIPAEYSP